MINLQTQKQTGFSIIEILISAALGIFLTAGALSIYLSNKESYQVQQAISDTLKNSRFIISRLEKKINTAGYSGFYTSFANGTNFENVLNSPTNLLWNLSVPVFGYNNVSSSDIIAGITGIADGTDVLILKSMVNESPLLSQASSSNLTIGAGSGYNAGNIVIVTDIAKASVFQIDSADNTSVSGQTTVTLSASATPQPGNATLPANLYDNTASAGLLETVIYVIKTGANGKKALFEGRLTTSSTAAPVTSLIEMVPNVENIQFIYGIDTDNDDSIDKYSDASAVTTDEWKQVHTIGVSLLLASESDNISAEASSYSFSATDFTYTRDATPASTADKRLKKFFSTYIVLKNL